MLSYKLLLSVPTDRARVLGGLGASSAGRACLFPHLAYNAAVGVPEKGQAASLALLHRGLSSSGRQTELRPSPEPREFPAPGEGRRTRSPSLIPPRFLLRYARPRSKVP